MASKFFDKHEYMKRLALVIFSVFSIVVIAQQLKPNNQVRRTNSGVVAQIECLHDYTDTTVHFDISAEALYQVHCTGEAIQEDAPKDWHGDLLQLYFDVNHNKLMAFSSKTDDRFFHIGIASDTNKATVKVQQLNKNTCIFEAKISWKVLGKQPSVNTVMGFDMAFSDNDGKGRETQLTWHANDDELWINTSLFGNLMFVNAIQAQNDSTMYCVYSKESPIIDGKIDAFWKNAGGTALEKLVSGTLDGKQDCQVKVKAIWNETGLYFLAEVIDDKIALYPGPVFHTGDYGWIENSSGEKVWELTPSSTKHAGGALKNRVIDTALKLKAGHYTLHYVSDESHSPIFWDNAPPKAGFYGIILKK